MIKSVTEWTIRRKSGSILRRLWTDNDEAADTIFSSMKQYGHIPQSATLQFEIKRTINV